MNLDPAAEYHLVGKRLRLPLGSYWKQPFMYFSKPDPGQFIGQVIEIPSATPKHNVQLAVNGDVLKEILSDIVGLAVGDWVIVQRVFSVWKIVALAELEDLSDVLGARMEVRDKSGGKVFLSFDLANSADDALNHIKFAPSADISFEVYAIPQFTIPPGIYKYDLFFYYSATTPFSPVLRQFGDFEVSDSITRHT